MNKVIEKSSTARVKADKARIDRLKEQLRSTPAEVDFERIRIMEEVYAATEGDQNIMRRAKFMATLLERKKLYIDDNLFVGSMASTVNGIYTYPEWNIDWMKDDNTVEKCKDPEDKRGQPVGARLLGKAGAEAPHAGDLREEVWLRSETLL